MPINTEAVEMMPLQRLEYKTEGVSALARFCIRQLGRKWMMDTDLPYGLAFPDGKKQGDSISYYIRRENGIGPSTDYGSIQIVSVSDEQYPLHLVFSLDAFPDPDIFWDITGIILCELIDWGFRPMLVKPSY